MIHAGGPYRSVVEDQVLLRRFVMVYIFHPSGGEKIKIYGGVGDDSAVFINMFQTNKRTGDKFLRPSRPSEYDCVAQRPPTGGDIKH